nr:uncharacterized protein LOC129382405 [Dermacentor andersoni]
MPPNNPLLFCIQTLLFLLLQPTAPTGAPSTADAQQIWLLDIDGATRESTINLLASKIIGGGAGTASALPPEVLTAPPASTLLPGIKLACNASLGSGHGSSVRMPPNNPLLFCIQCPRLLCDLVGDSCAPMRFLLLLGGDVESNPGPILEELAAQLKLIAGEIKNGRAETNENLNALDKKLEKIASLETKVTDCVNRIAELECSVEIMAKKLDALKNRSRRSNLIVYGVEERDNESTQVLETTVVKEIFEDVLGVTISGVERIHRLENTAASDVGKRGPQRAPEVKRGGGGFVGTSSSVQS